MKHDLVSFHSEFIKQTFRKNYGSRIIFGDEKLTPLRSVPRCALTPFLCPAGLKIPFGSRNSNYAESPSARDISKIFSSSEKFPALFRSASLHSTRGIFRGRKLRIVAYVILNILITFSGTLLLP